MKQAPTVNNTKDQLAAVKARCDDLGITYTTPYPGMLLVNNFANKYLGIDPAAVLARLDETVPIRRAGDKIIPGALQWVNGDNENLKYRGNVLRRRKIWTQSCPIEEGTFIYSYTGYTYAIAPATSDWNEDKELASMSTKYNEFIGLIPGAPMANHAIVTAYDDGKCSIGMHSDKMHSLHPNTIIAVLKIGGASRRFCIRECAVSSPGASQAQKIKDQEAMPMLFDADISSGDLILMTAEANLATQHGVPELETADAVGLSGSIVWRTAAKKMTPGQLAKKIATTEANRTKRRNEKRLRECSGKSDKHKTQQRLNHSQGAKKKANSHE